MQNLYFSYQWELGEIYIVKDSYGISRVFLLKEEFEEYKSKQLGLIKDINKDKEIVIQLDEYFKGTRNIFTVPLSIKGTEFQKTVWNELCKIPYGETRSYGYIAQNIGKPKASQAIGQANKVNKIPIFIPCHRVINKSGNIGGYMGKTDGRQVHIKKYLLELEMKNK